MTLLGGLLFGLGLVSSGDDPAGSLPPAAARKVDFDRDVRPIFAASCLNCHGPKKRKGGLALHLKAGALAGGDDGPVILPGKSLESRLLRYVAGLDDDHPMPPEGAGDPLKPEQVGVLRAWIEQGASWPDDSTSAASETSDHWAFRRPIRPEPPAVHDPTWPRNPIDRFVMARLDREGLKPSPEADRIAMIRRLSLDLIGLPPTIAEVDAFVDDPRDDAYDRLVDRLLASPHYGERWARRWLDGARVRRYQRLREGPRTLDLALSRLGHRRPEPRHAVRPLHRRADRGRLAPRGIGFSKSGHRVSPEHDDQRGGWHRRRGVPLRLDRRPGRDHRRGLARPDHPVCPVPHPQVRPDYPARVLPVLRLPR